MAGQERIKKQVPAKQESKETEVQAKTPEDAQALKDEMDELLDEIDGLLEENAEEFVRGYVQKGGQASRTVWHTVKEGFLLPIKGMFPLGWQ